MSCNEVFFEDVDSIKKKIQHAISEAKSVKVELLKHYLLNYILYINSQNQSNDSPIKEKLLRIAVLLEKLANMEKKIVSVDPRRVVDNQMMKNRKGVNKKSTNPGRRFRAGSEKLKERMTKHDETDPRKSRSNKFS